MINNLQISGVHSQLTKEMRAYVRKKIGGLDKYIPKHARQSTFVEVKLKEKSAHDKRNHECEVIMKLPKSTITIHKDSTAIFAAIDEVENNFKTKLKKYKDLHSRPKTRRHLMARFKQPVSQDISF